MSLHIIRMDVLVVMSLHTIKMVALVVMSLHSHQNECIGFKKSIKQNGSGAKGRQRWGEARWFISSQCASSLVSNFTVSKFQAYSCYMFQQSHTQLLISENLKHVHMRKCLQYLHFQELKTQGWRSSVHGHINRMWHVHITELHPVTKGQKGKVFIHQTTWMGLQRIILMGRTLRRVYTTQ